MDNNAKIVLNTMCNIKYPDTTNTNDKAVTAKTLYQITSLTLKKITDALDDLTAVGYVNKVHSKDKDFVYAYYPTTLGRSIADIPK